MRGLKGLRKSVYGGDEQGKEDIVVIDGDLFGFCVEPDEGTSEHEEAGEAYSGPHDSSQAVCRES